MFLARWAIVVFLLLMAQATWVPKIRIAGVGPDLLLGVVFVLAMRRGATWGAWTGFVMGLLIGVENPSSLGVDSLAFALAGIAVGKASMSLDRGNPLVQIVLLFLAAAIAEAVRALWAGGFSPSASPLLWVRWGLPASLYTTLLLPLIALAAARVLGRREWYNLAA